MGTKFAHIADTHIRNLKYHYEYRHVFQQMYEVLREQQVDYIIHCGDIAHTKTQISPEFVEMAADFFTNLATIAPTYIILGNHDGNLKNSSRQDALSPIIDALNLQHLHLLKGAGETVIDSKHCLNVLSVFDEENWVTPSDNDKINIALYHGSVSGVTTDSGWVMEHGEHPIEIFEGHDFAFLGDIHKTNQVLDEEGRVRYSGSTIQQNHGESNDKGFLIWDIEDKDKFTVEHYILKNPKPFVTIALTPKGRIPKGTQIDSGARLRLVSDHNIPLDKLKKAVDVAKRRFKPEAITFLNRAGSARGTVDVNGDFQKENLRDMAVQERLIGEYLNDYEIEDELLERVFDINRKYNSIVEAGEEVQRNVNWSLKSLEFDNLFNYGESNKINFENLSGIVGIFGKNFSGKSSIIDSLLWTLYNSTSKRNRKSLDIINQNREYGSGKVEIEIGDNTLVVDRRSEKYVKRLKGEETEEAKTSLDFSVTNVVTGEQESLNGETRNNTDKNIRKFFGTLDDFLLTSMSSQLESLAFIAEGSTRRKEILAKFLDLEFFEQKYRLAKEDAADLRGALKRLEEINFEEELQEATLAAEQNEVETNEQQKVCESLKSHLSVLNEQSAEVAAFIDSIPAEIINIKEVTAEHKSKTEEVDRLVAENRSFGKKLKANRELVDKIDLFLESFDVGGYEEKQKAIEERQEELSQLALDIRRHQTKQKVEEKKVELLNRVPCGSEFSHCQFIRDAYAALESLGITKQEVQELSQRQSGAEEALSQLEPEMVNNHLDKYQQVLDRKRGLQDAITSWELQIAQNKTNLVKHRAEIKNLKLKIKEYEDNREAIENLETLLAEKEEISGAITKVEVKIADCQEDILQLYKIHGSLEQKLNNLSEQQQELEDLREKFSAYDLFMQCMHSNGISLDIIKRELPMINEEVAKVLANVVDFEVFLENDEKRLNILIKHPMFDPRPLEMGSGAEKTIAAMAIRLALLSVSSMPKSDIFILDEPGTALDEENMEGFVRILDLVKSYYKTVLLISHLDSLKDCVDMQIMIDKKDGFASVNQ